MEITSNILYSILFHHFQFFTYEIIFIWNYLHFKIFICILIRLLTPDINNLWSLSQCTDSLPENQYLFKLLLNGNDAFHFSWNVRSPHESYAYSLFYIVQRSFVNKLHEITISLGYSIFWQMVWCFMKSILLSKKNNLIPSLIFPITLI